MIAVQLSAKWNNLSSSSLSQTCTPTNSYSVLQCSGCNPTPVPTPILTRRFVSPPLNKTISAPIQMSEESKKTATEKEERG